MAKIAIIGGGGMVGQKLAASLDLDPLLGPDDTVALFDRQFPETGAPAAARACGSVTNTPALKDFLAQRFDVIYHLACIPSGGSEADFDLGYAVNMTAFWTFLELLRAEHHASGGAYVPKVVFTSSIAVFGAPFPDKIADTFFSAPQTSYGTQKAISELLLSDVSRLGIVDGLSIRLPTICVRPGKPNSAASSFFSGIIREPLNGQTAILPVPGTVRHWHASPRAAVAFLRHAATLDTTTLNARRALSMPGLSCTVEEQIEALRDIAGNDTVALIHPEPDETIMRIVDGWPRDFDPARAIDLGFHAETDFHQIIRTYIDDDLPKAS